MVRMGVESNNLSSGTVARQLRVRYPTLFALIRDGDLPAPAKDSTGRYVWSAEDVERARRILEARRVTPLPEPATVTGA
jgi:DNA-binding transcriptional MerR regulator